MKPFLLSDVSQGSPEWLAERLGRFCASDAPKMLASIKSGEAAARRDLRMRIVCERITKALSEDTFVNADMQRGKDLEPQARIAYEFARGVAVTQTGFLRHRELLAGCSPDGVIGDFEGLVEIKCPRTARHVAYLRDGGVPSEHRPQLLHQLWISGASFVDFVSFDPLMPERLQLFVTRLDRNEFEIAEYETKARAFLAECDREVAALLTMANLETELRAAL